MSEVVGGNDGPDASELYGEGYYAKGCGPIAYDPSEPHWSAFFGAIADDLIRIFRPKSAFDAGCALGFLVEALWDRGVATTGRDISRYAISKTRADIRPFCSVGSLADPIEDRYDLVVCIEVLEHMAEQDALRAVAHMTAASDRVVFSSSPDDLKEETHVNVKPPIYWMRAFAEHSFAPMIETTLFSITPYALVFERKDARPSDAYLAACAEVVRSRLKSVEHDRLRHEYNQVSARHSAVVAALAAASGELDAVSVERDALAAERDRLRADRDDANLAISKAKEERARLAAERDRALASNAVLGAERVQLDIERERLLQERRETEDAAASASRLLSSSRREMQDAVQSNAQLLQQLDLMERSRLLRSAREVSRAVSRVRGLAARARVRLPLGRADIRPADRDVVDAYGPDVVDLAGFDAQFYIDEYPDVLAAAMDPVAHYLEFGRHEGRFPSREALQRREQSRLVTHRPPPGPLRLLDLCDPEHDEVGPRVADEAFLISVVTPTFNTPVRFIRELYQSLANQTYGHWEWDVVDDGSTRTAHIPILRSIARSDPRVRFSCSPTNLGISGASNAALASARGSYVALVDHDDLLARDAFMAVYRAWQASPDTQLFYTDECLLQPDGQLVNFWAKPDFSPAYLEYTMCLGHLSVYRRDFIDELGGFRREYDGTQDFDLALRALLRSPDVRHVPVFAYLWRISSESAAGDLDAKGYAVERQRAAVLDYARQRHPDASVDAGFADGYWRIRYPLPSDAPLLSFVIPASGTVRTVRGTSIDLVLNCIRSFEATAFYPNREYIVVHSGNLAPEQVAALEAIPNVRLLLHKDPTFNFSRTLNAGVARAQGEYVCLLNDDVEAISTRGGEEVVSYLSVNRGVGAIGPKCLFEDGRIQQHGVVLLDDAGPAHAATGMPRNFTGHHFNLLCRREVYCIGAAILFMRKDVYAEVGGFREDMPLNYNDVDFSLRLREHGYTCVVDPTVEVYHFESATKIGTAMAEQERMFRNHPGTRDPYFSRWFDPGRPDFHLDLLAPERLRPFGAWLDRHIALRRTSLDLVTAPKVSVCIEAGSAPLRILDESLRAVAVQTHPGTAMLVMHQGAAPADGRRAYQTIAAAGMPVLDGDDLHTIGALGSKILELVDGALIGFLDGSDFISVDALELIAAASVAHPAASAFYTDEYEADHHSTRAHPFYKPDFDPVLLSNLDYTSRFLAVRRSLLQQVCVTAADEPASALMQHLVVQTVLNGERLHHVREPTYARRTRAGAMDGGVEPAEPDVHARARAVVRLLPNARGAGCTLDGSPGGISRLRASAPAPHIRVLDAEAIWGSNGEGAPGLAKAAESGAEWLAVLPAGSPDRERILLELSAPALFDARINVVSGLLLQEPEADYILAWSGGLFAPGGRVFDPFQGMQALGRGHKGLLSCQRCVDVAAPVNVLLRAAAVKRVVQDPAVGDADTMMVALGIDAHERDELACVTPHVWAVLQSNMVRPPADRRGLALKAASVQGGSRWYDGRLEVDRSYAMPGCLAG